MKRTLVALPNYNYLSTAERLSFLGSCFSEHMAEVSRNAAFDVSSNPFGVIFNPISLANIILWDESDWRNSVFQQDDKFLSWNAHSSVWSLDKDKLIDTIIEKRNSFFEHIEKSKVLFVTFGSAWVYERSVDRSIVANCHKVPQKQFDKRCLNAKEIIETWENTVAKLKELNPKLKIVFTVSPVRHIKDGLIENNRSKAVLISSVHDLCNSHDNTDYFPSYEILIDELRDYAYYGADGVHPNEFAIQTLKKKFFDSFLSENAKAIIKEFESLRTLLEHKQLHTGSSAAKEFENNRESKKRAFLKKYPDFKNVLT
tara:strand:+ start:10753 stop:11694 length:942 start_codon:yes stop_codon:yes gene_type:complete